MAFSWKTMLAGLLVVGLVVAGKLANYYHTQLTETRSSLTKVNRELKLAKDDIADMQKRQRDVAALDAKYTQELADAKAENDVLQRKLDNGGRVLVNGRCPVPTDTKSSGPAGMGNDATIELSDIAGRNVLGIRSGIKKDQSALMALQEYINTQCLK
ncbi:lysis protein [Siccibacter colletis]|uniref:Lysis protein n=1 Tax=Siccibacter colletis TaxID=1505757 RepID=A0ABY6JJZ9_9ENTR|nr:lysis protein [Siccibacter colletis]UYU33234.1 lysis protein [Siccibacter colletis]